MIYAVKSYLTNYLNTNSEKRFLFFNAKKFSPLVRTKIAKLLPFFCEQPKAQTENKMDGLQRVPFHGTARAKPSSFNSFYFNYDYM